LRDLCITARITYNGGMAAQTLQKTATCYAPNGWERIGPDFLSCRSCGFEAHWADSRPHTSDALAEQRRQEQQWLEELRAVAQNVVPEELVAAANAYMRDLAALQMEQQEAFLEEHLDLQETHILCHYPVRSEWIDGLRTERHSRLIALIPKEREAAGIPTPPEYAQEHFPCATIMWVTSSAPEDGIGRYLRPKVP
jgi:hypothetical protein